MITYIASHHLGATRFDCAGFDELMTDIVSAHGQMNAPTPEEAQQMYDWFLSAQSGALLEWRQGWAFYRNDTLATEVKSATT